MRGKWIQFRVFVLAALMLCAACSPKGDSASPSPSAPGTSSPDLQKAADTWLANAVNAAKQMKTYAFELELTQKMTGESESSNSSVKLDMQGRAELDPLKLDQRNKSDIDGDKNSLRAILVPDAYYMYVDEFDEWSKLSKEETADIVKTFSDLQVNPAKSMESVRALGSGLSLKESSGEATIRYAGNGPEAKLFLDNVLMSTLDLTGMEPSVRESIRIESLEVTVKLDAEHHWPLSYRIDSELTVEYEPGKPSRLEQSLYATYSKPNAIEPIVVPEAAKNAPELEPPLEEDFDFGTLE